MTLGRSSPSLLSSRSSSDSSYYKERTSSLRNFYEIPKHYCKTRKTPQQQQQLVVVKDYETSRHKSSASSSEEARTAAKPRRPLPVVDERTKSNSIDQHQHHHAKPAPEPAAGSKLTTRLRKSMTMSTIKPHKPASSGLFHFLDFKNLCILMSCRSDYGRLGAPPPPSRRKELSDNGARFQTKIEYTAEDLDEMNEMAERRKAAAATATAEKNADIYQEPQSLLSTPAPRPVAMARPEEIDDDFSFSSLDDDSSRNGSRLSIVVACVGVVDCLGVVDLLDCVFRSGGFLF